MSKKNENAEIEKTLKENKAEKEVVEETVKEENNKEKKKNGPAKL